MSWFSDTGIWSRTITAMARSCMLFTEILKFRLSVREVVITAESVEGRVPPLLVLALGAVPGARLYRHPGTGIGLASDRGMPSVADRYNEPTVMWRMQRGDGLSAHAVIGPAPEGAIVVGAGDRLLFSAGVGGRGTGGDDPAQWLIFGTGRSELGVHPTAGEHEGRSYSNSRHHSIALMCDDLAATRSELESRGAGFSSESTDMGFGTGAMLQVPGADDILLYQPSHASAFNL